MNNNHNLMFTIGTSQKQRLTDTAELYGVKMDDRDLDDLLDFMKNLATQVQYYNENNLTNGDWQAFFEKPEGETWKQYLKSQAMNTQPHLALIAAFLKLFKHAQNSINELVPKNLEYYFRQVLKMASRDYIPDQVHVLINLAQNTEQYLLPKGTQLNAGIDESGNPLQYKTTQDLVASTAQISQLKTLYIDQANGYTPHVAPIANSDDGLGSPLSEEKLYWPTFGSAEMPLATLGFAFASPLLYLAEGNRTINAIITINKQFTLKQESNPFQIRLSGAGGWIVPKPSNILFSTFEEEIDGTVGTITTRLIFTISLDCTEDSITSFVDTDCPYTISLPLIEFSLDSQSPYTYQDFKDLQVLNISLNVGVKGLQKLVLQNDQGLLDPNDILYPFGTQPVIGSSFYIGNTEVFSKKLVELSLNFNWYNLPVSDNLDNTDTFTSYYKVYSDYYNQINQLEENLLAVENNTFMVNWDILYNNDWESLEDNLSLFATAADNQNLKSKSTLYTTIINHNTGPMKPLSEEVNSYSSAAKNGFVRLTLTAPNAPIRAFGHVDYPNVYTAQAIKFSVDVSQNGGANDYSLPNQPYTPALESVSLDYFALGELDWVNKQEEDLMNQDIVLLHRTAFGSKLVSLFEETPPNLFPTYSEQGYLYIGLTDIVPGQSLSILFQVAEGSEVPDVEVDWNDIQWQYLSQNNWNPLSQFNLLSDTTNRFQNSGILSFEIPENITNNNALMPGNLYWLRVSITSNVQGVCQMISLDTQAVLAVFAGNDASEHLQYPLAANNITQLEYKVPEIKDLAQPYASFGGRPNELLPQYLARVTERLRHKQRSISPFDYERLVLEQFPNIYKAYCMDQSSKNSGLLPGQISLIVVPSLVNQNAVNLFQPKVSSYLLDKIKTYLIGISSDFLSIVVKNPQYEAIQLDFKVLFKEGYDNGYFGNQLNQEIKEYLSPWAYKKGYDITFGGKLYKSAVQAFVESRTYVDLTSNFFMRNLNSANPETLLEMTETASPFSILVSANDHQIEILESGSYACEGLSGLGIGYMVIGSTFQIETST